MLKTSSNTIPLENEVWRLVEESRRRLVEAKDKRLILLVGPTGAGKSALINYLNGSEMEYASLPNDPDGEAYLQVKSGQMEYAEIGHGARRSKTLHPQAVSAIFETPTPHPLAYIDMPGSSDAHLSEAERLCTSVALPMSIHHAEAISGIIVVIDTGSFASRGKAFSDFINLLGGLLNSALLLETESTKSPLMFVFTHVDRKRFKKISAILARIEKIKAERAEEIQPLTQDLMSNLQDMAKKLNRTDELLTILELLKNPDRASEQVPEIAPADYPIFLQMVEKLLQTYKPLLPKDDAHYRYAKTCYDKINDAYYELIALGIILKYKDSPDNHFIIDGEGSDDRKALLTHIQNLSQCTPIDKASFIFQGRAREEWLQLDALLQKTAEKAATIKQTLAECPQEMSVIKKYSDFLKDHHEKQQVILSRLQISQGNNLESVLNDLKALDSEFEQYLNLGIQDRKTEQEEIQTELDALDTAEPTRYLHPLLGPVDFSTTVLDEACVATLIASSLTTGFGNLTGVGIGHLTYVPAAHYLAIPMFISIPLLLLSSIIGLGVGMVVGVSAIIRKHPMWHSYDFSYCDLPFVKAELHPDISVDKSVFYEEYCKKKMDNAFFSDTREENKDEGIFKISGHFSCGDVHIKLFVEKRIHPNIKPRVDLLKQKLERLQYAVSHYFQEHLSEHKIEQEKLLACNTATDKKAVLVTLLTQRIEQYSSRFSQLNSCLYAYKSSIRDAECAWHADVVPHLATMEMTYDVVKSQRIFVKEFIAEANLNVQEKLFEKELKPYSHVPSSNSFAELANRYGLYAQEIRAPQSHSEARINNSNS